jgi:hypothetical protein
VTFLFAVTAGIGFASVNIADVAVARASRVTPAVTAAQGALADAQAARDRECRGGVGRFCRERETAVASARQDLELAMHQVEDGADPQVTAAVRLISWTTRGAVTPSEGDISMLRLMLMALLPQCAGLVLMLGGRA